MRSCTSCRPCWPPGPAPAPSADNPSTPRPERRPNEALLGGVRMGMRVTAPVRVGVAVARNRVAGPQRRAVEPALVGEHRAPVAAQLLVLLLGLLPPPPLPAQLPEVLAVPLVRPAPGRGHLPHGPPGIAHPADRDPGRHLD